MAKWIYEKHKIDVDLTGMTFSIFSYTDGYVIDLATVQASYQKTLHSKIEIGDFFTDDGSNFNAQPSQTRAVFYKQTSSGGRRYNITPFSLKGRRIAGDFIENVIADDGAYPNNGIHTDGFWYVKIKPAFPEIKLNIGGVLKTATATKVVVNGQLRNITDVYIVVDGQLKKIK